MVVERIIEDALLGMNMTPIRLTRKQIGLYGLCMWVSEGDCPGGGRMSIPSLTRSWQRYFDIILSLYCSHI